MPSSEGKEEAPQNKEEAKEERCTCGHFLSEKQATLQSSSPSSSAASINHCSPKTAAHLLDTSFVHLPALLYQPSDSTPIRKYVRASSNNFWEIHQHLEHLIRACQNHGGKEDEVPLLCSDCITRVERALDADSERLENESFMYQQAAQKEEERIQRLEKALQSVSGNQQQQQQPAAAAEDEDNGSDSTIVQQQHHASNLQATEQAFRDEIWALEQECNRQEAEVDHLKSLRREQLEIAEDLAEAEYELEVQRNALELEARAFNNDQEQLFQSLQDIHEEVDKLSSSISLPSILLDLQVDKERGLRYPLINELRLAYRPKGDIKWNEIQVAWSLAAQLLLVVGTLFHYPSEQWKIIPLSNCAKLIFFSKATTSNDEATAGGADGTGSSRKGATVFHLGHPKTNGSKALKAWNTLLHQVILHVNQTQEKESLQFPKLPFLISSHTIGNIDLNHLNENDDAGWSRAIHFMASNLLWLSECAALYTSHQVLWTAAVLQSCKNA